MTTVEEHTRKFVSARHETDWDEVLPIFLLAFRASTHAITCTKPASIVYETKLSMPLDLCSGATATRMFAIDYVVDLVDRLRDI